MEPMELLNQFMSLARDNPRVTAYHISVYVALLYYSQGKGGVSSFTVFSREVLPFAKLLRPGTYHRLMTELSEYGYIGYCPSHSPILGSLVHLPKKTAP